MGVTAKRSREEQHTRLGCSTGPETIWLPGARASALRPAVASPEGVKIPTLSDNPRPSQPSPAHYVSRWALEAFPDQALAYLPRVILSPSTHPSYAELLLIP